MELTIYHQFGIALGLGLIVGLQRQWAESSVAGIRTFPLITVLGALCALLAAEFGGWVVAAGLGAVAAMIVVGNIGKFKQGKLDPGVTSEVAALVMFAVGALLVAGYTALAVIITGGVAVLLHWKAPLHKLVSRFGESDLRAIIRLVLIGMVILPILPDKTYGPYDVLNPFHIWLMVVLIVGISLGAYLMYLLLGQRVGTLLGGVLGGLISSTATTVGYARRTRGKAALAPAAAIVIMIASTTVFGRVLGEIAIVAPSAWASLAPPLVVMMAFMAVVSMALFVVMRNRLEGAAEREAPSNLTAAIIFGLLYAAVLFGVAAAKEHFGNEGLYVVAALSGLTDMDAITLSTAQLVNAQRLEADTGWRVVLVGAMANLVFKGGAVALLADRRLFVWVASLFGLSLLAAAGLLAAWPG